MKTNFELGQGYLVTIAISEISAQLADVVAKFNKEGYNLNESLLKESVEKCLTNEVASFKDEEAGYGVYVYLCKGISTGRVEALIIEAYCLDETNKYSVYVEKESVIVTKKHAERSVRIVVKGTQRGFISDFKMTDELAAEISDIFAMSGFDCSVDAVKHNFFAWRNDYKSCFVIGETSIYTPCGCNPLSYTADAKTDTDVTYVA